MAKVKIKKFKFFFIILCVIQLFYIFHFRSGFKYEIIKNPFNENAGISYALSSEVIEANSILKKQKVTDFNLSEGLKKDTYLYQRIIEFNYPIRINRSEEHTSELQSQAYLVCRLLLEKKKQQKKQQKKKKKQISTTQYM